MPTPVYFDFNPIAREYPTGVAVYAKNLINQISDHFDYNLHGFIKLSRRKRAKYIRNHTSIPWSYYVPGLTDFCIRKNAIYHGLDFKVPTFGRFAKVVTIHDFVVFEPGLSEVKWAQLGQNIQRRLLKKTKPDKIIVPTNFVREHILQYFPEQESKLHVIAHGCDHLKGIVPQPSSLFQLESRPFILALATLEKRKNIAAVVAAYSKMTDKNKPALILAGGEGYQSEEVHRAIALSNDHKNIFRIENLTPEQIVWLYQNALYCIYPSLYEGFGLPILEAMQVGCPIITSDLGAMKEVAGQAALLVNPTDINDMTEKMQALLKNPSLRQKLLKQGLARAQDFTWHRAAEATSRVYNLLRN